MADESGVTRGPQNSGMSVGPRLVQNSKCVRPQVAAAKRRCKVRGAAEGVLMAYRHEADIRAALMMVV